MLYDYESLSPDELELFENDQVLVLESADEEADDGFCFGRVLHVAPSGGALANARVGRTGFFPSVMVEPLTPDELQELAGALAASALPASGSGSASRHKSSAAGAGAGGLKDTLTKWVAELRRAKQNGGKGDANGMLVCYTEDAQKVSGRTKLPVPALNLYVLLFKFWRQVLPQIFL